MSAPRRDRSIPKKRTAPGSAPVETNKKSSLHLVVRGVQNLMPKDGEGRACALVTRDKILARLLSQGAKTYGGVEPWTTKKPWQDLNHIIEDEDTRANFKRAFKKELTESHIKWYNEAAESCLKGLLTNDESLTKQSDDGEMSDGIASLRARRATRETRGAVPHHAETAQTTAEKAQPAETAQTTAEKAQTTAEKAQPTETVWNSDPKTLRPPRIPNSDSNASELAAEDVDSETEPPRKSKKKPIASDFDDEADDDDSSFAKLKRDLKDQVATARELNAKLAARLAETSVKAETDGHEKSIALIGLAMLSSERDASNNDVLPYVKSLLEKSGFSKRDVHALVEATREHTYAPFLVKVTFSSADAAVSVRESASMLTVKGAKSTDIAEALERNANATKQQGMHGSMEARQIRISAWIDPKKGKGKSGHSKPSKPSKPAVDFSAF